ncbi:MAG: diguanylate cyclase [Bauldia sp.]
MSLTLKAKLIGATVASVAAIAAAVASIAYGASTLSAKLAESEVVTVAMRNHTNADMMHDALRADVFEAMVASANVGGAVRRAELLGEARKHSADLRSHIAANMALALPGQVIEPLAALEKPLATYAAAAENLVATAFDNRPAAADTLPAFEQQFETLEIVMRNAGDSLAHYAAAEQDTASRFLFRINLFAILGLIGGLLIAAIAIWIGKSDVLNPLGVLAAGLRRLTKGEYTVSLPTERGDEIGEIARALSAFAHDSAERIRLSRETRVLSQLNEWLQSAKSEAELYAMIGEFLTKFLPESRGSIYVYSNSRDILECTKAWNGSTAATTMHPDDCWGLRRGRTYVHGEHEIEFHCTHVGSDVSNDYCCIPILAHGETVGLLHLEYAPAVAKSAEETTAEFAEQCRLGLAAREHISLAIANVKLRDQLRDQSIRDVLTGLYNRRYLLETGRREFQRAARNGVPVAVLSLDVDHFKTFNDNHGHDAGDAVLRHVGEVLSSTFRGDDVACRFGGEEFVILLPGASPAAAAARAEQIRNRVETISVRYADGTLPRITISVGVACFPQSGASLTEVLKVADEALYRAKELGRNRVELAPRIKAIIDTAAIARPALPEGVEDDVEWADAAASPDRRAAA